MEDSKDDVRSLYGETPERFIEARDALAARLKTEGRPDEATAVKRMKKPTVPAWALNQLAARDPAGVDALIDAGSEIRAAQQAALSTGGRADRLRDAVAARRTAVVRLSNAAAEILREAGKGAGAHVDDVASALEIAAVDDDAGRRLRSGTFERPPAGATGFGNVTGLTSLPGGGTGGEEAEDDAARRAPSRGEVRRLERERDAAHSRGQRARQALTRAADRVASAEDQLHRLRAELEEAEAAARGAELEERRSLEALRAAGGDVDDG